MIALKLIHMGGYAKTPILYSIEYDADLRKIGQEKMCQEALVSFSGISVKMLVRRWVIR